MNISELNTQPSRVFFIFIYPLSFWGIHEATQWAGGTESLSSFSPLSCPLHKFLGIHCPTCGLTRSLLATWNFDFALAFRYHFLGPVLLFLSALFWFSMILQKDFLWREGISKFHSHPRSALWAKVIILIYIVWGFAFHNIG